MKEVNRGDLWDYKGVSGEEGRGATHYVLSTGSADKDDPIFDVEDEVITYSKDFTWLGPKEDFVKQFKPTKSA